VLFVEEFHLLNRRSRNWLFILVSLLVIGALFLLTRINQAYIERNPGGGQSFTVQWVSLQGFLIEGISPYSQEAVERTQREVYGRLARPGEDQLRFLAPLYSTVVFFPFALIPDMQLARALWMTLLETALLLLAFFSMRLANWRGGWVGWILVFLFSVFWFHALHPLIEGDAIVLVALMLVGALVAIQNGSDELAGLLLALMTIKISVVLLPLVFILLWAAGHRRWTILGWTGGTILLLGSIGALLLPNWIIQNAWQVIAYQNNASPGNIRAVMIELLPEVGNRLGWAVMAILVVVVLLEWFFMRRAEFRGFLWAVYLTVAASLWLGPATDPGNYLLAFPPLLLVFAIWEERWRRGGRVMSIAAMILLFAGLWALYQPPLAVEYDRTLELVFFFPLPVFLFLALYWVRWWAVRPPMWFDLIYQRENPGRL
jgi:hypothetical protein